ncbi:Gfo/Idh/MocA family protein [Oceanobacillus kapialis]|uniref:Gfo/Idh/MocA family protein n=1 Tax=Oceanobacillus kapialis TaxID=481353 RepID=UPI003851380F
MKIGIMSVAHMHAHSYIHAIKQLPDLEVAGIYDDNTERGQEAAAKHNVAYFSEPEAFLAQDMQAVIVCSENVKHKEMVLQAAKAKKHILCEKPIATNLEDAAEMITSCNENEVILQIAFPVRFSTPIRQVKAAIERGEVGDVIAFRTTNRGQNPGGWFIDNTLSGGGAVLDHTVHMVDIMRWFSGKEITAVHAHVDSFFHDIPTDDMGLLTLGFEEGIIASHDASWSKFAAYPTWGDVTIEVIGTKKTIRADALQTHLRHYQEGEKPLRHEFFGSDMDLDLIKDFSNTVKHGGAPSITGYDGLKALEVSLAAYESSKKRKTIRLGE